MSGFVLVFVRGALNHDLIFEQRKKVRITCQTGERDKRSKRADPPCNKRGVLPAFQYFVVLSDIPLIGFRDQWVGWLLIFDLVFNDCFCHKVGY